jgi:multidrug efflux pump subunit AcrB
MVGFTLAGSTSGAYSHLDWRSGVIVAAAAPLVLAIAFIAMR